MSQPASAATAARPLVAAVIGAGMGGLRAARALADHFERVVVLERDALPDSPSQRPGAPQGRHVHVLLAGGLVPSMNCFRVSRKTWPTRAPCRTARGWTSASSGQASIPFRSATCKLDAQDGTSEGAETMIEVDEQFLQELTRRYEPTVVPACRRCGAPLEVVACGGGSPTRYDCSTHHAPGRLAALRGEPMGGQAPRR